jgi:hypothetical protein
MEKEIILTSKVDLRSLCAKLGLKGKLKLIKCITSWEDHKPRSVSSTAAAATGISTIVKHAFLIDGQCFFYKADAQTAVAVKLGSDVEDKISAFEVVDSELFKKRLRMAEAVSALTKYSGMKATFRSLYEDGFYEGVTGPVLDAVRVQEAYDEFVALEESGINKYSHPAHFKRISHDRGICAVGLNQCVKRI